MTTFLKTFPWWSAAQHSGWALPILLVTMVPSIANWAQQVQIFLFYSPVLMTFRQQYTGILWPYVRQLQEKIRLSTTPNEMVFTTKNLAETIPVVSTPVTRAPGSEVYSVWFAVGILLTLTFCHHFVVSYFSAPYQVVWSAMPLAFWLAFWMLTHPDWQAGLNFFCNFHDMIDQPLLPAISALIFELGAAVVTLYQMNVQSVLCCLLFAWSLSNFGRSIRSILKIFL